MISLIYGAYEEFSELGIVLTAGDLQDWNCCWIADSDRPYEEPDCKDQLAGFNHCLWNELSWTDVLQANVYLTSY